MARIRSIKPDFWTDESLSECSVSARLLFIGTWTFADDEGNLDRSARQLKMRVFPGDCFEVEPLLLELISHGLLIEYEVDGKKYLHIKGFKDHQIINRASKPVVPVYEDSRRTHGGLTLEGKGEEGKGGGGEEEPTNTELAFLDTFKDKETDLKRIFPNHNYEVEKAICVRHYRLQPTPIDPYVVIMKWFQRGKEKTPIITPQDYLRTEQELRDMGLL